MNSDHAFRLLPKLEFGRKKVIVLAQKMIISVYMSDSELARAGDLFISSYVSNHGSERRSSSSMS